jgi:hypothetical protein
MWYTVSTFCSIPDQDGYPRRDGRRAGVDPRLYRRSRSIGVPLAPRSKKNASCPHSQAASVSQGFALTEPAAGSDLTALRTTATLDGNSYVLNGEKLFITNVIPGRTAAVVALIDKKPAVLIVDLPAQEDDTFRVVPYGLYALRHANNNGLRFTNFRYPKTICFVPLSATA